MSDIINALDEARRTFSVLDAAKGKSYPQDTVTVYTDTAAAYEAYKLEKRINASVDSDEVDALALEQKALRDKVKASAKTFLLRGISKGLIKRINEEAEIKFQAELDDRKQNVWANFSYLAAHIISVTDADGAVDERKWSFEDVDTLQDELDDSEFQKIMGLMLELTFATDLFDASVTADFLLA